jgi:predicted NBD/HSP70 family sugar kinase
MRASDQTLNRLAVLKAIRRHGPVSRSELPGLTGLSGGTITQLTADLVERGLVSERRDAGRRMGRPRVQLEIDASAAVLIGARLGARLGYLTMTFVDLLGKELFASDLPLASAATLREFAGTIAAAIEEAIAASPFEREAITRAGLALPAVVDSARGTVHFMTTFPPEPFPIAGFLSERLGMPVTIENDLSCMARAEHWFGRARELDTFTMISVGYSVDSAEYLDGLPKSGANGLNPEIGHVKLAPAAKGRRCYCGDHGCLNSFSSMYGILEQTDLIEVIPPTHLGDIDAKFEVLLDRAEAGDHSANAVLDEAADYLGIAVANHLMATDPGNVLIVVRSDRFLDRIRMRFDDAVSRSTLTGMLAATEIEFIVADPEWWQAGTAALALEQTYLGLVDALLAERTRARRRSPRSRAIASADAGGSGRADRDDRSTCADAA